MKFDDVDARLKGTKFMSSKQGRLLYDFIVERRLGRIIELGFAHGKSSCYFGAAADELGGDAHVTTMDRSTALKRDPNIHQLLERCGLAARVTPVFSHTTFTWDLMKMLERLVRPHHGYTDVHEVDGWGWARKRPA